jgi:hypothetical protein
MELDYLDCLCFYLLNLSPLLRGMFWAAAAAAACHCWPVQEPVWVS